MRAGLRGTAERKDALDHLGIAGAPLVGQSGTHLPTKNQFQRLDTEVLGDQAVLAEDIVVHRDVWESRLVARCGRIAGRRRKSVAEHVRHDDEVLVRVKAAPGPNQPFILPVTTRVPGRIDDRVSLVFVQRAIRLIGQARIPQCLLRLEYDVSKLEDVVLH